MSAKEAAQEILGLGHHLHDIFADKAIESIILKHSYDDTKYQMVPREPTKAMISAMYQALTVNIENNANDLYDSYKAMLAAAPKRD